MQRGTLLLSSDGYLSSSSSAIFGIVMQNAEFAAALPNLMVHIWEAQNFSDEAAQNKFSHRNGKPTPKSEYGHTLSCVIRMRVRENVLEPHLKTALFCFERRRKFHSSQ